MGANHKISTFLSNKLVSCAYISYITMIFLVFYLIKIRSLYNFIFRSWWWWDFYSLYFLTLVIKYDPIFHIPPYSNVFLTILLFCFVSSSFPFSYYYHYSNIPFFSHKYIVYILFDILYGNFCAFDFVIIISDWIKDFFFFLILKNHFHFSHIIFFS